MARAGGRARRDCADCDCIRIRTCICICIRVCISSSRIEWNRETGVRFNEFQFSVAAAAGERQASKWREGGSVGHCVRVCRVCAPSSACHIRFSLRSRSRSMLAAACIQW